MVHFKDGKYVSPKKYVNDQRQGWNVIVDSSLEDRCFQLFSKKIHKNYVFFLFFELFA